MMSRYRHMCLLLVSCPDIRTEQAFKKSDDGC